MGSSAYDDATMGRPAKEAWQQFRVLGAKMIGVAGIGDDAVGDHAKLAFDKWMSSDIIPQLEGMYSKEACGCGKPTKQEGCCSGHKGEEHISNQKKRNLKMMRKKTKSSGSRKSWT
jgi:hypothetical protein